jgi:hypothetical protein
MNPEELHRRKLKEMGYVDEAIEKIVEKYIKNCVYEFAISYHDEMSKYSQTPVSGSVCLHEPQYQSYNSETKLQICDKCGIITN